MSQPGKNNAGYYFDNYVLTLEGPFTIHEVNRVLPGLEKEIIDYSKEYLVIDLDNVGEVDSAGITAIYHLIDLSGKRGLKYEIKGGSTDLKSKLELFKPGTEPGKEKAGRTGFIESIGTGIFRLFSDYFGSFSQLAADITYWSVTDLLRRKTRRKGEFYNQAVLIGVNAVLIVGLMSFIIGLVLALQSAAQLRSFGANIYIVDLTVIAMMSEMGPLITAIMVAGRSGSSIAAEIATMQVTNETDALRTMGLNPVRFIVVPKMHGALVTMPFLTIIADVLGIAGGLVIAVTSLGISPIVFLHRMEEAFMMRDVLFGIIKSLVFGYLIVITGSFFGFRVKQGAEGVGKVTTVSVVAAISLVIIADSIMGLLFY